MLKLTRYRLQRYGIALIGYCDRAATEAAAPIIVESSADDD